MNDNHDDKQAQALGLLAAGMGALLELLSECRTAITEQWDDDHPQTIELVEKLDIFLGRTQPGDLSSREPCNTGEAEGESELEFMQDMNAAISQAIEENGDPWATLKILANEVRNRISDLEA